MTSGEFFDLDSVGAGAYPDGTKGKKNGPQRIGESSGWRNAKFHIVSANGQMAMISGVSVRQACTDDGCVRPR